MSTVFAPGDIAIAVCDRCRRKVPYKSLRPDGNSPGLRVCQDMGCWDPKDPWRLPPIQPDAMVLRFPRPDTDLTVNKLSQAGQPPYPGGPYPLGGKSPAPPDTNNGGNL